ncbi:hypothetical protein [Candidatus Tisiphia endosymbiont of Dascillus cervinus]|uniref:hypothetical protein n=1 Tax=Candidatus Tisiphia endosymbiont of Dascillus cervinus TaxID=3066253 RepID=UPI00312CB2DA
MLLVEKDKITYVPFKIYLSSLLFNWQLGLKRTAHKIGKTVYQIKLGLLDHYMQQQLRSPSLRYLEPYIA